MLPNISLEQRNVIEELLHYNVCVDSVAGSGKTTCSLYIAKNFPKLKILLLTYNAKLKIETREKVNALGITNLEVHSYHSFCVKNYDKKCFTDTNINLILKSNKIPLNKFVYDIIILDEAQDISPLYYELFCKIYKDNKNAKICIFGDINQSIFEFNNADERFITFADELFNFNDILWRKCKLSESFRITHEMSLFINNCLLNDERILSSKITNNKPRYIICDCFGGKIGTSNRTFDEVKYYLDMGYLPQDIFILAPSIKSDKSPVRQLENKMKRELTHIQVYVPTSEDEKLDNEILDGKLVFSTFHQTKGLERKVIIIFNFDNSYFEFYKKGKNPFVCPNELYVATTRGLEHLSILHHYNNNYLPFICKEKLELYCCVENNEQLCSSNNNNNSKNFDTSPTDLIKHIPQNILDECFNFLEIKSILPKKEKINIPLKTNQDDGCEGVSEITGVAIPSFYELKIKGKIGILDDLLGYKFEEQVLENNTGCLIKLATNKKNDKMYKLNNINLDKLTTEELLYIANCWTTHKSGFLFKIYQIQQYSWLSTENLLTCINRMEKSLHISVNALFEKNYIIENEKELLNRKINGFVDCIDNNNLYEFKCVQTLEKEHFLQLAIYMYQNEKQKQTIILQNKQKLYDIENQIKSYELKIQNLKNINISFTSEYGVGDIIKYKIFDIGEGIIKKIYKNGKFSILNNKKQNISITKSLIISVIKRYDNQIDVSECDNSIKNLQENAEQLKNIIKLNIEDTNYYLYNILTDELLQINCELNTLIRMIEILVYNKYINSKIITNEQFLQNNLIIKNKYFSENYLK
jgi:hypothetical protein